MRTSKPDYIFHTTCVGSTGELIQEMQEAARDSTYATLLKHCEGFLDYAVSLGYGKRAPDLTLRNDWSISYHKSRYAGQPCLYFVWSRIEHIWLKVDHDHAEVARREAATRRPTNAITAGAMMSSFFKQLKALRPKLAAAAQRVYDEWAPDADEETGDPEVGFGGICQDVADAIADVIVTKLEDANVDIVDTNGVGDQHVWVIAYTETESGTEAYHVDVPPELYETGSGYSWQKRPDVTIEPADVTIVPADDFEPEED